MTLYECPLCGRTGFTRVGLSRHYCPATEIIETTAENWSPLQRRRRLRPEEIAAARPVADRPPTWGPYRLGEDGWYRLEGGAP